MSPPVAGRRERTRSTAVLVYVLLQVFLLVVAVEGLLGEEEALSWWAAGFSVLLFGTALGFVRFLRDG